MKKSFHKTWWPIPVCKATQQRCRQRNESLLQIERQDHDSLTVSIVKLSRDIFIYNKMRMQSACSCLVGRRIVLTKERPRRHSFIDLRINFTKILEKSGKRDISLKLFVSNLSDFGIRIVLDEGILPSLLISKICDITGCTEYVHFRKSFCLECCQYHLPCS